MYEDDDYDYDSHDVDFYDAVEDDYDDPMDGDHESGLASAGFGTDEDYGYYGEFDDYSDYNDSGEDY